MAAEPAGKHAGWKTMLQKAGTGLRQTRQPTGLSRVDPRGRLSTELGPIALVFLPVLTLLQEEQILRVGLLVFKTVSAN